MFQAIVIIYINTTSSIQFYHSIIETHPLKILFFYKNVLAYYQLMSKYY